jgi:dienelactone hydrolase
VSAPEVSAGVAARPFTLSAEGRKVPGLVWSRPDAREPRPLVLVGHGGSGSKETVAPLAEALVRGADVVAAAIDGPVHGARRDDDAPPEVVLAEFRALWRDGTPRIDEMVADWSAALAHVVAADDVDGGRVGWCGLSMGTAYGVPFVAAHPELRVAALGMWGLSYPSSERLAADAPRVRCPVLFQRKADDALFSIEGQEELFARFGSVAKQLVVYPGPHAVSDAQVDDLVRFLGDHLGPGGGGATY